jgi:quaternary ammonium compound-resistance protein SugE
MVWFILVLAGVCEIIWPLLFRSTKGFTDIAKNWPIIGLTFAIQVTSFYLMSKAIKSLPVGTVYAVWTGVGTMGIAIVGMFIFQEPRSAARLVFLLLIVVGLVGLRYYETPPT